MSRRLRRFAAVGTGFIGLVTLAYSYYGLMVLQAYEHMFEALRLGPAKGSPTALGHLLPVLGGLLVAASAVLFAGPEMRQRFHKSGKAS